MGKKINFTQQQIGEIKKMYLEEKKSCKQIARVIKCSNVHIRNFLKKSGISVRSSKDQIKNMNLKGFKYTPNQKKARSERVKQDYINHPELREKRRIIRLNEIEKERLNGEFEIVNKRISETRKKLFAEGKLKSWSKGLTKETNERVRKYAEDKIGTKRPDLTKRNLENNPMNDLKSREKSSIKQKENRKNPNSIYNSNEYKEKQLSSSLKSLFKRPTSFEQKISELCIDYNLPFMYTGDGRMLIGYKNPDFVNEKDKIVIEVFLDYFKIRDFGSIENYMKKRGEHFTKYGWRSIFISQKEIEDKYWEKLCLNKIKSYL